MTDDELHTGLRQILLALLDILERRWGISPTTAEIRKAWKRGLTST